MTTFEEYLQKFGAFALIDGEASGRLARIIFPGHLPLILPIPDAEAADRLVRTLRELADYVERAAKEEQR